MGVAVTGRTTLADWLLRLGDIPPHRIRMKPLPGQATEKDLLRIQAREDRICELVDGVLVEKPLGFLAARLAAILLNYLEVFCTQHDLGVILTPDAFIRLGRKLVRAPDVAFYSWRHFPNKKMPTTPIPTLVPELAVEVLSDSNTVQEMRRKRREYFAAGVQVVWLIDPDTRTAQVFTAPDRGIILDESQSLDGGSVLPGFTLALKDLFASLPEREEQPTKTESRHPKKKRRK
jgi:Uma2 family endonuclease